MAKAALRIYDPFFCEGRVVRLLSGLGFENVYNRNEDFYAVKAAGMGGNHCIVCTRSRKVCSCKLGMI